MDCEYYERLNQYDFGDLVTETEHWLILLAPDQRNLGTLVIALKRKEKNLSGLNMDEWIDFGNLVHKIELSLKKAFPVTLFNWGCLLNSAYKEHPPQPQVHWHLIPRYKSPVYFNGIKFEDPCFGKSTMHARGGSKNIDRDVRDKIIERINYYLNI